MKYLVTGGAGFIGSHIVEELVSRHHEIVVLDNLFSGTMANIQPFLKNKNVAFIQGSITDLQKVQKACEGVDGIFHEAAIASVQQSVLNPQYSHEVNATGTLNVLIAARDCGVKKVVCASTAAVYGDDPVLPKHEEMMPQPSSPYAVAKLAGEYYCSVFSRLFGVQTASLRYFNVFGPRQNPDSEYSGVISKFIARTKQDKPITIFGDGEQTRDFVFISDVVSANIQAMEQSVEGVFNIGCGHQTSVNDLAAMVKTILGTDVPVMHEPPREGDIKHSCADISKARSLLKFSPAYSVQQGLERTAAD